MKVEIKALEPAWRKRPCLVCAARDVPGDAACFTEAGQWVCNACVKGGEEYVRFQMRDQAAYYRSLAEELEAMSEGPLKLPTAEALEAAERAVERYHTEEQLKGFGGDANEELSF